MIDHTGHPHPSTPKARALCRANGGTGFIGKLGDNAPTAKKKNDDKPVPRVKPRVIDTTPKKPDEPKPAPKTPTVPKDHGSPKPTPKPDSKPKTPVKKPLVATAGEVARSPKDFDPKTMELKDGNGNWRKVSRVEFTPGSRGSGGRHRRAGEYTFYDENGKVIRQTSPNEKVTSRAIQGNTSPLPIPPRVPPRNLAGTMSIYIPPATGNSPSAKIQNALRRGASRDFIVEQSKSSPTETNREIDRILTVYGVPNHVYQRKGSGAPAPKITDVKKGPAPRGLDTVSTPTAPNTIGLGKVDNRADSRVKATVDRVLKVQESHVGGKVARIKSVDSKLPSPDSEQGKNWQIGAGTLAVCTHDGKIHLHEGLHSKDEIVNRAMASGWFTKGGQGVEQTIAHEMGHAFLNEARMTPEQRKRIADSLVQDFGLTNPFGVSPHLRYYGDMLTRIIHRPSNKPKVKRLVSKYGATNASELMAEVWSEYTMNPKPRPRIKKLGDILKGIIGEGIS